MNSSRPQEMILGAPCEPSLMHLYAVRPTTAATSGRTKSTNHKQRTSDLLETETDDLSLARLFADVEDITDFGTDATGDHDGSEPNLPLLRATCDPSQMAPSFHREELEMKTMIDVTHAGRGEFPFDQRRSFADVETSRYDAKAKSAPSLMDDDVLNGESSGFATETCSDADKLRIRRSHSMSLPCTTSSEEKKIADDVDNKIPTEQHEETRLQRITNLLGKVLDRFLGILDVPLILVFGIILYLVDVGSDITAAVVYLQEGHLVWGSLTITFVVMSAVCWAAVSWTWWYNYDAEEHQPHRKIRMVLSVLLLDPLVR